MKEHRVPDGLPYLECGRDLFTKNATSASLIPNFESKLTTSNEISDVPVQ
jgi:hypothetical protein